MVAVTGGDWRSAAAYVRYCISIRCKVFREREIGCALVYSVCSLLSTIAREKSEYCRSEFMYSNTDG